MEKYLFKILRFSGLTTIFKIFYQRNTTTILLLHDIKPEIAEKIFSYLVENYNIISLHDFINALETGDKSNIPLYSLIITFDDGFKGNYQLLPVIKKYNIPITIFLCSEIIGTCRQYWFKYKNLQHCTFEQLKSVPNTERLELLKKEGFSQTQEFSFRQALSLDEINEMKDFVDFQSHTMFHPFLPNCSFNEAKEEISNSKANLEIICRKKIEAISYPNGNYSEREIELCKQAGYLCGITVDNGFNSLSSDPYTLKRMSVNDTNNLDELIVKSSGAWSLFKKILIRFS